MPGPPWSSTTTSHDDILRDSAEPSNHRPRWRPLRHRAVRVPQPIEPPARRIIAGLNRDQRPNLIRKIQREMQTNVATHRAAHNHRLVQAEFAAKGHDKLGVEFGGELIFIFPPAGRGGSICRDGVNQ